MGSGSLSGKVVVVTGSSRGIGKAVAAALGSAGASVVINGRAEDELAAAKAELARQGFEVLAVPGNVTRPDGPERLVAAAAERFGAVTHVVNMVAVNPYMGPLLDMPEVPFSKTMLSNTWTAVAMVQAAARHGLLDGDGAVVNISTAGARQYQPMLAAYCASKAALESLTVHLAHELGPHGVRVNTVAPGLVRTDMARVLWDGEGGRFEEAVLPLRRIGEPDDVAAAVAFLCSGEARWITGCLLSVDGGRSITSLTPGSVP